MKFFIKQGQTSVRRRFAFLFHWYVFNGRHTTQVQRDILFLGSRCDVLHHVYDAVFTRRPLSLHEHGNYLYIFL